MMEMTLIYLVPTISTERAKTDMKIPWAPIPVTSLCHDGDNEIKLDHEDPLGPDPSHESAS